MNFRDLTLLIVDVCGVLSACHKEEVGVEESRYKMAQMNIYICLNDKQCWPGYMLGQEEPWYSSIFRVLHVILYSIIAKIPLW